MTELVDLGEPVTIYADFLNTDLTLYDPATVTLVVTRPDGTVLATVGPVATPYAGFTHIGTGRFSYLVPAVNQAGVWTYLWTPSQGAIQDGAFLVGKTTATDAPCDDWCRPEDVFGCTPASAIAEVDRDYATAVEATRAASRGLYILSGRKYPGICQLTVRPCRRGSWDDGLSPSPGTGHAWRHWGDCGCGAAVPGACACGGVSELCLSPDYRVLGIASVYVDGQLLSPTAYRVDDDRWLVRTDGDVWPSTQDLTADPHADPDTFEVHYWFGAVPPADGRLAAKRLSAQYYAACAGLDCQLPGNVRSLIRQGVAIDFSDPAVIDGLVGIREVDRFLETERYGDANAPSFIIDPEAMPTTRRVAT